MAGDLLQIDATIPEAIKDLDELRYRQLPFATSLALNNVGKLAKGAQVQGIQERFTVRREAFIRRSVVQRAASKRNLETVLTVRDPFLARHEEGGTFRAHGRALAIPKAVRRTRQQVVSRGRWPGALRRKGQGRVFYRDLGAGSVSVVQRVGRGKSQRTRVLWTLVPEVKLEPRLRFESTVSATVARNWEQEFGRALAKALATAR